MLGAKGFQNRLERTIVRCLEAFFQKPLAMALDSTESTNVFRQNSLPQWPPVQAADGFRGPFQRIPPKTAPPSVCDRLMFEFLCRPEFWKLSRTLLSSFFLFPGIYRVDDNGKKVAGECRPRQLHRHMTSYCNDCTWPIFRTVPRQGLRIGTCL